MPLKEARLLKTSGLKVAVFCSANELDLKYQRPAQEMAKLLAEHGHSLIFGGSNRGLMKIMADGMKAGGAKLYGFSVEFLKKYARQDLDELIIAKTIGERKMLMLERADVLIMLPGGTGTLDEITDVIELKKHGRHQKPILVLNTDHFYDGLHQQINRMHKEGFLWHEVGYYLRFFDRPSDLVSHLNSLKPSR